MPDDAKPPTAPPAGEPAAGTEPGGGESSDTDEATVRRDPGTAGDTPDPDVAPPSAVMSAEGD